ncbi:hypothetical protein IAQ61_006527 [Plenodomus lingam]|uniref:uncharacterized protein n=1 Tax=Leptosphaeria maculans TaxID=5022 RepID=UPI00331789EE|nr:hypothetical protein IAQ61_006527 [Plenodomus lingam]
MIGASEAISAEPILVGDLEGSATSVERGDGEEGFFPCGFCLGCSRGDGPGATSLLDLYTSVVNTGSSPRQATSNNHNVQESVLRLLPQGHLVGLRQTRRQRHAKRANGAMVYMCTAGGTRGPSIPSKGQSCISMTPLVFEERREELNKGKRT